MADPNGPRPVFEVEMSEQVSQQPVSHNNSMGKKKKKKKKKPMLATPIETE